MAAKWGRRFWADYAERVGATLVASLLGLVTLTASTGVDWSDGVYVWSVLGVPTVVTALKGLLANLTDPSSGPSLLPAPPAPVVEPEPVVPEPLVAAPVKKAPAKKAAKKAAPKKPPQ